MSKLVGCRALLGSPAAFSLSELPVWILSVPTTSMIAFKLSNIKYSQQIEAVK